MKKTTFVHYLDPSVSIDSRLAKAILDLGICHRKWERLKEFMAPLRLKDIATYEHSVRVGLLAWAIGKYMHLDPKALFYAGLLHDVGKVETKLETLQKTEGWTEADTIEIKEHVMAGYWMVRGCFDFSAEIILWHHKFQPNSYPAEMPPPLHDYSHATQVIIPFLGRVLALADQFDAYHRVNDKFVTNPGEPLGEVIKKRMLDNNPDQRDLVADLYCANILTVQTFEPITA